MKVDCIDFKDTNQFGKLFLDYVSQKEHLAPFYNTPYSLENIASLSNNYNSVDRETLVSSLDSQNNRIELSEATRNNINKLLQEDTFTITTGHQLNLATGPLFFIFKILAAIRTAEELSANHPKKQFVPVFWMATEDHDFEEINNFNLFGKKYEWNTDQKGAVGRFNTEGIQDVLKELPEAIQLLEETYQSPTLSDATRFLVNKLFGEYGLVILDADDRPLKKRCIPLFKKELLERKSEDLVKTSSFELEQLNYKAQVFPRPINLFYLTSSSRERILFENGVYKINNTELTFSEEGIIEELEAYPERFSPNVILRPIYQQIILPNLSYIGGPGELAYWLQLKSTFEHYSVNFPVLQPRTFGLILNGGIKKKIEKLQLNTTDLFKSYEELKSAYLSANAENIDLSNEREILYKGYEAIISKGASVDPSLRAALEAEWQRFEKQLGGTEKRIKKAEEKKHEITLNQIKAVKEKLFPNGGLQERSESVFTFYINNTTLIQDLKNKMDLEQNFKILYL